MAITQSVLYAGTITLTAGTGSQSVTVPSGAEIIVASLVGVNSSGPTTVTYNGVSLTSRAGIGDGNTRHASIWDLLSPTVGTFNVVVTGSNGTYAMVVRTLTGINTSSPRGTAQTYGGFAGNRSVTLTTAVGDLGIDIIGNINTLTTTDSRATDYNAVDVVGTTNVASSVKTATTTSTAMNWTHGSDWTVLAAVPYVMASGGASNAPRSMFYHLQGMR